MFEGMFGSKNVGGGGSVVVVDDAEEMSRPTDRGWVCLWEGKVHGRGGSSSDRSRVQNTRAGEATCTPTEGKIISSEYFGCQSGALQAVSREGG